MHRPWQTWFISLLLVPNVLGSILGFWWYKEQLSITPLWLWFFTTDCPVYGTLFAIILILWLIKGHFPQWLLLLTTTGLIKYGAWFTFVVAYNWVSTGDLHIINTLLVIPHLIMAAQGVVFLRQGWYTPAAVGANIVWLFLNDIIDYGLGVYPWMFQGSDALAIRNFTLLLSGTLAGVLFLSLFRRSSLDQERRRKVV